MYILAFETSCDDTSIAIFKDDQLIAMDTKSQIKTHTQTQGVVPEVAAREHANNIFGVLENVLKASNVSIENIDYIAVTTHPGLIPSLITWVTVASTISLIYQIPIVSINHIEAHIFSNFLERKKTEVIFPLLCLTASGWHTDIFYMKHITSLEKVGATQDDAAGEAFDKVAKMMWLGYPGGPIISELAHIWKSTIETPKKWEKMFPRVWLNKEKAEFSFSGLKTAVKREIEKRGWETQLTEQDRQEISYEFSEAILEVLSYKLVFLWQSLWVKTIALAGWVSANDRLRELLLEKNIWNSSQCIFPKKKVYCMDNAAMIGITAYYKIIEWVYQQHIGSLDI